MHDLIDLGRRTLSWRGRASRRAFWMSVGQLYLLAFLSLLLILPLAVAAHVVPIEPLRWAARLIVSALSIGLGIGSAALLLGTFVRRLHDRGKSGWWLLLFFGPHGAMTAIMSQTGDTNIQTVVLIVGFFLVAPFMAWGMVEIFLLRGTSDPNAYGPAPADPPKRDLASEQF